MTLSQWFAPIGRAALAFSGGVDSVYLLYAGLRAGCDLRPFFVKTPLQTRREAEGAQRLAEELGTALRVVEVDILSHPQVAQNPPDRCYHCKRQLFTALWKAARADSCQLLLDGTNASDDSGDRPGMRALAELSVRSPLRECGITKGEIRRLSREAGLPVWDKPASPCLATRVPTHTPLTPERLAKVEQGEELLSQLGFSDFRVRLAGEDARIQLREEQLPLLLEHRAEILTGLGALFSHVTLDLEVRP